MLVVTNYYLDWKVFNYCFEHSSWLLRYANLDVQRNMAAKQWVFPESDVIFPDTIDKNTTASTTNNNQPTIFLGRGTFGEVYVGKWRHVDVAVKKLHQAASARFYRSRGLPRSPLTRSSVTRASVASVKAWRAA